MGYNLLQLLLLRSKLLDGILVTHLRLRKSLLLRPDVYDEGVVLLEFDHPFTETFGSRRRLRDSAWLKLRVVEELTPDFFNDVLGNGVFLEVKQVFEEVLLIHHLLSSEPPVVLHDLGVVLLGRFLTLAIEHDTDRVHRSPDCQGWVAKGFNFVDVLWLDRI